MTTQAATADTPQSSREFVKAMTLTDATMLVAGSMIGSGIFIVSADISRTVGSPFWLLMAWVVAGVVTILGALAYGELAAMYPELVVNTCFFESPWVTSWAFFTDGPSSS